MAGTRRTPSVRAIGGAAARGGLVLAAVALSLLAPPDAGAQDVSRGRQLFGLCATCHGSRGGGNQQFNAPAIAGFPRWYVEAQLTKFQDGVRGARAEDTTGLQMRPMARALGREGDVAAVAAYVAALKPVRPPATLEGDPTRGRVAYAPCSACHGPQGLGNEALGAPALAYQADWYLAGQLRKFRQGLRGANPRDVRGAQMRAMAMTLPNDQAIHDVVAYIRSLGE